MVSRQRMKWCFGRTFNSLSSDKITRSSWTVNIHLRRGRWLCDADSIIVSGESGLWHALLLVPCAFRGGPFVEVSFYCFFLNGPLYERFKRNDFDELMWNPADWLLTFNWMIERGNSFIHQFLSIDHGQETTSSISCGWCTLKRPNRSPKYTSSSKNTKVYHEKSESKFKLR